MYQCPSCGAGLVFNPQNQMLKCHYCNSEYNLKEIEEQELKSSKEEKGLKFETTTEENENKENVYDAIIYRCTQCGAELLTTDETISTFCSYCGSSALLEKKNTKKEKPSYIIPFTKTKEECEEAYRKKLRTAFFAPSNMAQEQQIQKIRGIYMPYWIYSFEKNGPQSDRGSRYSHRVGDYVYYDDYTITTNVKANYKGVTHDASANFADSLSEAIAPFSIKDKKEFSPTYLSGFYADSEDVNSQEYVQECTQITNNQASIELKKDKTYSKYGSDPRVNLQCNNVEMGLFPVYFLATKNKTGDRVSYAVVNGQTGKVAAEIPIDFKKYVITSLLLAVPIFFLLNAVFTFTPGKVLIASIIFSIISLIISNNQLNEIFIRENNLRKGKNSPKRTTISVTPTKNKTIVLIFMAVFAVMIFFMGIMVGSAFGIVYGILFTIVPASIILKKPSDRKPNVNIKGKYKFKDKIKKLYKPIIAIGIAIIIFILNPVSDMFYYAGAIASILMTIWSFADLVKELNLLTTRKLPHLEKRGGDEHE